VIILKFKKKRKIAELNAKMYFENVSKYSEVKMRYNKPANYSVMTY